MQAEADRLLARKVSDEVCHLRIASMCNKHMYQLKSGRSAFFFLHDGRISADIQKEKDTCRTQMPLLKNSDFSP